MRSPLTFLLPGAWLALATLTAALPWGWPDPWQGAMPMLPYVVLHFWAERRPRAMPDWLVFMAGLATDILGQGPLGYFALVYLVGYALVQAFSLRDERPGRLVSIVRFLVTAGALVLLQWAVASLYHLRLADVLQLMTSAGLAAIAYAVLAVLFPAANLQARRFNDRLERGT